MVIVYGAGISGKGSLELLKSKGIKACLVDDKLEKLKTKDALLMIENEKIEYIVKSPGISFKNEFILKAMKKGIKIISEIDLAYMYMDKKIKIIAFTGTNGKTTTTIKMYELLKKANFKVALAGNVGNSFAKIVSENLDLDYIVLELSSYQLENMPMIRANIAGIINLTPDHLSRYENLKEYYYTKFNIYNNQTQEDYMLINLDDKEIVSILDDLKNFKAKKIYLSKKNKADVFAFDSNIYVNENEKLINVRDISLKGEHNLENMLFVIATAFICNVSFDIIKEFLKEASSVEHRMEDFFKLKNSIFINDSKGTNVDSTSKALNSYNEKICLICGGEDKKVPLEKLALKIKEKAFFTYIYGENRFLIENELKKINYKNYLIYENILDCLFSIKKSFDFNEKIYFLFSPATSSFDQFSNFEQRGKYFKEKVIEILGEINV